MHPGIERWNPTSIDGGTPSRTQRVDFDRLVRVPILVRARKNHDAAVAKQGYSRIPAAMGHVLDVRKGVRRRIKQATLLNSAKRIIEEGATVDHHSPVRECSHAVAKHVPPYRQ